ncbi:MAG: DMT family transporter, partial [Acidimicrobiia bacterium]
METRVWAAIVVASFGYGTTGVATRAALNAGVPPIALAAIRAVLAAVFLAALFAWRRGRIEFSRGNVVTGMMAGLFQLTLPFILFTLAYQYASAGFVGLFVALLPLGIALMAHVMLPDEPLTRAKTAGLVLAFLGVALLLASGDSGLGSAGDPLPAALLTMGAVASLAFAAVF